MIGADLIIAAAGAVLAIVAFCMELPVWMIMIVLSVALEQLFIPHSMRLHHF